MKHFLVKNCAFLSVLFTVFFSFTFSTTAYSQNCNCDYTIKLSDTWVDASRAGIKPGSTVCVEAGRRSSLKIFNLNGTAASPIKIINCGGQVVIGNNNFAYAFSIENSSFFKLSGTGSSSHKYGFKIDETAPQSSGLSFTAKTTEFEVEFVEITNTGFAGIISKTDPGCSGDANRGSFTQRNTIFHDIFIHDTKGEGIYIGHSSYNGVTRNCNGQQVRIFPHDIEGAKVYNNIVRNTGWDGIQVGCATKGTEIWGNVVENFGSGRVYGQMSGIQISTGTSAKVYNNIIRNGTGAGIFSNGIGENLYYNNIITDVGLDGIFCDDRTTNTTARFQFVNNTIVRPGFNGIRVYSRLSKGNRGINNIIIAPKNKYVDKFPDVDWQETTNLYADRVETAKFVNAGAQDFRLQDGSPAIAAGMDVSSIGVLFDFNKLSRTGKKYDKGALASNGTAAPAAAPLTVSAGGDKSLTLPSNGLSITASGSNDISSYSWSKQSGPSATMSGTTTATLALSNLVAGTYVFKVTAKSKDNATVSDEVTVSVQAAKESDPAKTEPAPAPSGLVVNNFTLINSDSNKDIRELKNGDVIDFSALGTKNLNIRANVGSQQPGSVIFLLNGKRTTENVAPYAMAGDGNNGQNYYAWTPAPGKYTLVATPYSSSNGGGTAGKEVTISFTVVNDGGQMISGSTTAGSEAIRINCGGDAFTNAAGEVFEADDYFSSGVNFSNSFIADIKNASQNDLYLTERNSGSDQNTFFYEVPVSNGNYTVKLHFAEIWFNATGGRTGVSNSGNRVMSVSLEGKEVLSNLDIQSEAGPMTALVKTFNTNVIDGNLTIHLGSSANRAKISAIEIIPAKTSGLVASAQDMGDELFTTGVSVYPNPFTDVINVDLESSGSEQPVTVVVYDQMGRMFYQEQQVFADASGHITLRLSDQNIVPGVYFLKLSYGDNEQKITKLVKR
jgi:hypothetical protein